MAKENPTEIHVADGWRSLTSISTSDLEHALAQTDPEGYAFLKKLEDPTGLIKTGLTFISEVGTPAFIGTVTYVNELSIHETSFHTAAQASGFNEPFVQAAPGMEGIMIAGTVLSYTIAYLNTLKLLGKHPYESIRFAAKFALSSLQESIRDRIPRIH